MLDLIYFNNKVKFIEEMYLDNQYFMNNIKTTKYLNIYNLNALLINRNKISKVVCSKIL